jgi:hypothetical protein
MILANFDSLVGSGSAIILAILMLALIWHVMTLDDKLFHATRRAENAEKACEELRKSLMRGSAVVTAPRSSTNPRADRRLEIAAIAGRYAAFTDSVLPSAYDLYDKAVERGEIKPLPTIPQ